MANGGLPEDPLTLAANPYAPLTPLVGADLGPSLTDMARVGQTLVEATRPQLPTPAAPAAARAYYSPSSRELLVGPRRFAADDAASLLEAEAYPSTPPPTGGDWFALTDQDFSRIVASVRQPTLGRLASKSFGRGVDIAQLLAGRGLQLAGAEELGGRIVEQQMEDLRRTSPFERQFTDIESGRGAVEWLVANFAQQGPNLIESVATAALGFLGGTLAGGPAAGPGAALAGLVGKAEFKRNVLAALQKKAAGQTLDAAENKLLREAAGIAGAVAATTAQNIATGAADIYGELREQGVGPEDMEARITALAGSLPYAALENLTEFAVAARLFGAGGRAALPAGAGLGTRAGEYGRRAAAGLAIGGTAEGLTELGQEGLVMGLSGQDLTSPEATNRFVNAFAAGFGIGGPLGAVANLRSRSPQNLLNPGGATEPSASDFVGPPFYDQNAPFVGPPPPSNVMGAQQELFGGEFGPQAGPPAPSAAGTLAGDQQLAALETQRQELIAQRARLISFITSAPQELNTIGSDQLPFGSPRAQALQDAYNQAVVALPQINQQLAELSQLIGSPVAAQAAQAQQGQLGLFGQQPPLAPPSPQMLLPGMPLPRQGPPAPPTAPPAPPVVSPMQGQLLTARGAPAGEALRRGSGAQLSLLDQTETLPGPVPVEPVEPALPAPVVPPGQARLFTPSGQPTAAALRRGPGAQLRLFGRREDFPGPTPVEPALPAPAAVSPMQGQLFTARGTPAGEALRRPPGTQLPLFPLTEPPLGAQLRRPLPTPIEPVAATTRTGQLKLDLRAGPARKPKAEKPKAPKKDKLKETKEAAEAKRKAEAEAKRKAEAEAKAEAKRKAKAEADAKVKAEAEAKEAEKKKAAEAKKKAAEEAAAKKAEGAEAPAPSVEAAPAAKTAAELRAEIDAEDKAEAEFQASQARFPAPIRALGRLLPESRQEELMEIAELNASATIDQRRRFESIEDAIDNMLDNMQDTLTERGFRESWAFEAARETYLAEVARLRKELEGKPATEPAAKPTPGVPVTESPGEIWAEMDTGVAWEDLPSDFQNRWIESDRAQTTADAIAEDFKNPLTPESMWADMKTEDAPEFSELSAKQQAQWRKLVREGKASGYEAEVLADTTALTPLQEVVSALKAAQAATNLTDFEGAIATVVDYAYLLGDDTNIKAAALRAREIMRDTEFTDQQNQIIDTLLTKGINTKGEAFAYGRGADSAIKPWFDRAVSHDLLPNITAVVKNLPDEVAFEYVNTQKLRLSNLPKETVARYRKAFPPTDAKLEQGDDSLETDTVDNAGLRLANYIKELNTLTVPLSPKATANAIKKLKTLYAKAQELGQDTFVDSYGIEVSAYFDKKTDEPQTGTINGKLRVGTAPFTEEVRKKREARIAEDEAAETDSYESTFTLDDFNTGKTVRDSDGDYAVKDVPDGKFFRTDGTPIKGAIPLGRTQMLIRSFVAKLKVRPKVAIFRNQEDLKARNPDLYAQAVASRPQGDFDTANAVGFSFGDGNVLVFSDRVVTEEQLRFVLAHETLGHFGFRGLLTAQELNTALDRVYESSPRVKAAADVAVETRGLSRREAVEEYLADFAGVLDTNILARFWNSIKNALNKLGVTFEDDLARYLVSQSRRYVRNGVTSGSFVDFKAIAQQFSAIEGMDDPEGSGRFVMANEHYDVANRNLPMMAFGTRSFNLFDGTDLLERAKKAGTNLKDVLDRVIGELRTMNFAARENLGFRALYNIFSDTSRDAARHRAQYNKMMKMILGPSMELFGKQITSGVSRAQIAETSKMLEVTSRVKGKLSEAQLRKLPSLIVISNGVASINETVFDQLAAMGKFTLEDFRRGITYTRQVARPMDDEQRAVLQTELAAELAAADGEEARRGIERKYERLLKAPSYLKDVEATFPPMPNLTENDPIWIMYNEVRDTMNRAAADLLLANFSAIEGERDNVRRIAREFLGRDLTPGNQAFLDRIINRFMELRNEGATLSREGELKVTKESVTRANDFIKTFNTALIGRDTDRNAAVAEFFEGAEADRVFDDIEALKKDSTIIRTEDRQYVLQQAIQNLALSEINKGNAELLAKQTIAGGYVPFGREGTWQVRIQAVDPRTGRVYKVSELYRQNLFFAQVNGRGEAESMAEAVQGALDEVKDGYEIEVLDGAEYTIRKVKLVAQAESARQTVTAVAQTNLNEVLNALTRFAINITPAEREKLIINLTNQNASARNRLRRDDVPGADPNTLKYVSQHLEALAAVIARKRNRHRLDRLFDPNSRESESLWRGSQVEYDRRKAAWEAAQSDPNMSEPQKLAAKREFDDYHYTFITKEAQKLGNRYLDRGRRAVAFMEAQTDVDFTDFASGDAASFVRTVTTLAFLGASFATAALNYFAFSTNVLPTLSGYNPKNNFGGGFGWGQSSVNLSRAINDTKNRKQSLVEFWDELLANPELLEKSGFSKAEVLFMQKEVGGGKMQAALTNSLIGSARGRFTSGVAKRGVEVWMSLFNYSEQHSRRATGLAAFRMAYDRALSEGKDEATAFDVADQFAVELIDNTLGEYSMFNRPAMFRGDVRQFMFMFKMFPVNSIQMLAALPRKEQLLALGILTLFSGLKGLPFAEDLFDIIDTIAQALGLGPSKLWRGSAERTLAEAIDAVMPGMTPVMLKGLLNYATPANFSDRLSLSNIIPGSGIALAGADVGRELVEMLGPIASFGQGAASMLVNTVRLGITQPLGISPETVTFGSMLRDSPVTMLRAMGDIGAYLNTGAIVNRKGYVVSEDLHAGVILARALGFYPAAATAQNDAIRLAKRIGDYQKDVVATFRGMAVSAAIAGDTQKSAEVRKMVRDWNESARGTGLEIRNFEGSVSRALLEARRPATERFLRTQARGVRSDTERILELYGITEDRE